MIDKINVAVDGFVARGERGWLAMSESAWKQFKSEVPRRQYRKRTGTRFINAYRGVPISIHDEWSWGWSLIPAAPRTASPSSPKILQGSR